MAVGIGKRDSDGYNASIVVHSLYTGIVSLKLSRGRIRVRALDGFRLTLIFFVLQLKHPFRLLVWGLLWGLGMLLVVVSVDRAGGVMSIVLIDADAELSLAMAVRLPAVETLGIQAKSSSQS